MTAPAPAAPIRDDAISAELAPDELIAPALIAPALIAPAPTPAAPTPEVPLPEDPTPALPAPHARRRWRVAAAGLGRLVGGAFDGLAIGFTVAYLITTAASGLTLFLGFGPIGDMLVPLVLTGVSLTLIALLIAGVIIGARRLRAGIDRRLAARGVGARARTVLTLPFRVVGAIPVPAVPLLAGTFVVAIVGQDLGPAGLFAPAGALSVVVYLGGLLGALVGLANAIWRGVGTDPVRWRRRARRLGGGLAGGIAVVLVAGSLLVAADDGSADHLVARDPLFDGTAAVATPSDLEDPGLPGAYAVRTLSYGSGTDSRRPAFGADAALVTPTVDASALLPDLGGGRDEGRAWFWGFGYDALPLDGLVWYPEGDGPFPLVLIVHGNHAMGEFSEPGYAYLGELLASRGFIMASIDEDFLNGSWAGEWSGREQIVRAWLLRLHVAQFREWSEDPSTPFAGKVDLDRVALMGHSRGGEAASVAASWNGRETAPQGLSPWPEGITIHSVVSIAPSDGQYLNDASLDLVDVDFLTLTGGHDMDATAWSGIRQYGRTIVSEGRFKAALWTYRGNHGQFSTVWGSSDHGLFGMAVLNLEPLLSPEEQRQVAKVSIGAFLEASLHDRDGYRGLFRRPMIGREWLPDDIVLVRSMEAGYRPLLDASQLEPVGGGARMVTDGLAESTVTDLPLRSLQLSQGVVTVRATWEPGPGLATWGIEGIEATAAIAPDPATDPAPISAATELRFALANATPLDQERPLLDPLVTLGTTDGVVVTLPLSRWGALPPPLPAKLAKNDLLETYAGLGLQLASPVERVLQTYAVPLGEFAAQDPAFDPAHLSSITFGFDRSVAGAIYIGEVGLQPG